MCIYTRFRYMCLHEKLKIARACHMASLDPYGVLTCPGDPNPKINDGVHRTYADRTYGVGVCSSVHCAWDHGILPVGDYGDEKRFNDSASFEDDTEIADTPEAREDRVDRWYRMLDVDQQLDHLTTEYPLPIHERSVPGNALLDFPRGASVATAQDTIKWQELNPQCLTPAMLQWCVFSRLLPASVVDGRKSETISPHKPVMGPFKVASNHTCSKKRSICKVCGENIGHPALKEATLAHRQNVALVAMMGEDAAKEDPKGTMLDPSVDLKWDDERGEYIKAPIDEELRGFEALYPGSSTRPDFVVSTMQATDAAAIFSGPEMPLANGDAGSTTFSFHDGTSLEVFDANAQSNVAGSEDEILTDYSTFDAPYWPDPAFVGISDLPLTPQPELELSTFPFDSDMNTDFGADERAQTGAQDSFDIDMPMSTDDSSSFSAIRDQPNDFLSNLDPMLQAQSGADFVANNMFTGDHEMDGQGMGYRVDDSDMEQQMAILQNAPNNVSPETMRIVQQMLRQMYSGGVARPSYDPVANELFDQIVQHKLAGIID